MEHFKESDYKLNEKVVYYHIKRSSLVDQYN